MPGDHSPTAGSLRVDLAFAPNETGHGLSKLLRFYLSCLAPRPIPHEGHQVTVHPRWNPDTKCWACDATLLATDKADRKGIPVLDPVRDGRYRHPKHSQMLDR